MAPPAFLRLLARAYGVGKPNPAQWQRLGEGLLHGDPAMDRLVAWMAEYGMGPARSLFEQALEQGIGSVPDAPAELRTFFDAIEAAPAWLDRDLLEVGQVALRRSGLTGAYFGRDVALIGGYQFSGFNQTLIRTGALETGSNQRFAETLRWGRDLGVQGGLDPYGAGYRSTLRVRLIHGLVRRHVLKMPDWNTDEWGLPINQTDMAATLVGAVLAPFTGSMTLGHVQRPRDQDALAHLMRYVGWLMGVDEEWLPTTFGDGVRVLYHTSTALAVPDETTPQLAVPMMDDPLKWRYKNLSGLRRRLARAQHLSMTSILGPGAMRTLGLPPLTVPWYPALIVPGNLVRTLAAEILPGGRERAAIRGDREVDRFLATISDQTAVIGESVTHLHQRTR